MASCTPLGLAGAVDVRLRLGLKLDEIQPKVVVKVYMKVLYKFYGLLDHFVIV